MTVATDAQAADGEAAALPGRGGGTGGGRPSASVRLGASLVGALFGGALFGGALVAGALVVGALALTTAGTAQAQTSDRAPEIGLELFSQEELGPQPDCAVRLWQANRDPDRDRYAIVFHEALDLDHRRSPARIVIDGAIVALERVSTGGETTGYDLYPHQTYRSRDGDTRVMLELELAPEEGEAVGITGGRMIVVRRDALPFIVGVRGDAGCLTAAAGGDGGGQDGGDPFANLFEPFTPDGASVPEAMIALAGAAHDCDWREAIATAGIVAFQTSEEGGLWDLSCAAGMHNAGHVVAQVYLANPETFTLMEFEAPPGRRRASPHLLFNVQWDAATRSLTSVTFDRGLGDCGTYERHVYADGAFTLLEYREKPLCDGMDGAPQDWPLVYRR